MRYIRLSGLVFCSLLATCCAVNAATAVASFPFLPPAGWHTQSQTSASEPRGKTWISPDNKGSLVFTSSKTAGDLRSLATKNMVLFTQLRDHQAHPVKIGQTTLCGIPAITNSWVFYDLRVQTIATIKDGMAYKIAYNHLTSTRDDPAAIASMKTLCPGKFLAPRGQIAFQPPRYSPPGDWTAAPTARPSEAWYPLGAWRRGTNQNLETLIVGGGPDSRSLKEITDPQAQFETARGFKIYASGNRRICNGTQDGWITVFDARKRVCILFAVAHGARYAGSYSGPIQGPVDAKFLALFDSLCTP